MTDETASESVKFDDAITCLQRALSRTIDVLEGYEQLVDKAEGDIQQTLLSLRSLHRSHIGTLADLIRARGREPDMHAGLMSRVNQFVVSLRCLLTSVNGGVMPAIRHGEGFIMSALETAEMSLGLDSDRKAVKAMRRDLQTVLDSAPELDRTFGMRSDG